MGLTPEQKIAVESIDNPIIISAGAGSGKTHTLTSKMAYVINNIGILPERILCITFTNKAASELKSRLIKMTNLDISSFPWVRTIHSACLQMLKPVLPYIGYKTPITIYTGSDQKKTLRKVLKEFKIDPREVLMPISKLVSDAKDDPDPNQFLVQICKNSKYLNENLLSISSRIPEIFRVYNTQLKHNNAIDFDDILFHTKTILEKQPDTRISLQNMFDYILVDEFQDVNYTQNKIIQLLCKQDGSNLTVVGDDFQCWHKDGITKTSNGDKTISELKVGDLASTVYKQEIIVDKITAIQKRTLPTLKITTHTGKSLITSYQHKWFASKPSFKSGGYYLYLMYRHDKGFRIGYLTGGTTNSDRPDRLWFIKRYESKREARYNEIQLSTKYCILTLPFFHNDNELTTTQDDLDLLFEEFGENGWKLLEDLELEFDYPNYIPQGTTIHDQKHINVNLMINETRGNSVSYWSNGKRDGGLRVNYKDARIFAEQLYNKYNADAIIERFHYNDQTKLDVIPARQLTIDMCIPVMLYNPETNSYYYSLETITSIDHYEDNSEVYHVEMAKTGNLIVNDIITHNSIYGWRGSNPSFFINFKDTYPNCKLIRLEQNFRSIKNNVLVYNQLIKNNKNQIPKTCFSLIEEDTKPTIVEFENNYIEAKLIAEACLKYKDWGIPYNQIAIIYRAKFMSRSLERALIEKNIPYIIIGSVEFFERREVKELLSYIIFILNPKDINSFERTISSPRRGIGKKTFADIINDNGENYLYKCVNVLKRNISSKQYTMIDKFITLIHKCSKLAPKQALELIIKSTDFYKHIESYSTDEQDLEDRRANVLELLSMANQFQTLENFIEECFLMSSKDNEDEKDQVRLMTGHASKGLEFQAVFVIGLEDGLLPHHKALKNDRMFKDISNLEEERRLFYVMISRSSRLLNITYCKSRSCSFATTPSRFIKEIKNNCNFIQYKEQN